jgi:glucose-1-phosphate thymidylyltransferase
MKGIILAGGKGTRLGPMTTATSKQLLAIYDKPMIYYPLSTLMLLGIREIAIIVDPLNLESFDKLFSDGRHLGINIVYLIQESPRGIAEAFIIAENFIADDDVCLILGDNIFYGTDFINRLSRRKVKISGALITAYHVNNPSDFGVVVFDENMKAKAIFEKPKEFISNYAVPGIYFYDNTVVLKAKSISASTRGELEITSINDLFLQQNELDVQVLGRGVAWLDTGSPNSMLDASKFIEVIQKRQGLYVACLEEISYRLGYINQFQLEQLGNRYSNSDYGNYIKSIILESERRSV